MTEVTWIKGLPPLMHTYTGDAPDNAKIYGVSPSTGKAYNWETAVSRDRQKERSKTFPGIAKAIAEQWGDYLMEVNNNAL